MKSVITYFNRYFSLGLLLIILNVSPLSLWAKTLTAKSTGNWSAPSIWKGGSLPSASDDVVIQSGVTVTVDIATATCNSLTLTDAVGSSSIVFNTGQKIVVNGIVTLTTVAGSTGNLDMTNGGVLECNSFSVGNGTVHFTPGSGTIQLDATNTLPLSSFNNLLIAGETTTLNSNSSFTGNIINSGVFNTNSKLITLNGSVSQTISGVNFYDVTVNNSSLGNSITLGGASAVNHTLLLTKGIIDATSYPITFTTLASVTGASNQSHIKGTIKKIINNNSAFVFPCGNGNYYRPIGIISPSNDTWTASYSKSPYSNNNKNVNTTDSVNLDHVSIIEYWSLSPISASSSTKIQLSWDDNSMVTNTSSVTVAHWNSYTNQWENVGSKTIDLVNKTVTSKVSWTSFSPFTLGSTTSEASLPIELEEFKAKIRRN
jgi:hypothetical protein